MVLEQVLQASRFRRPPPPVQVPPADQDQGRADLFQSDLRIFPPAAAACAARRRPGPPGTTPDDASTTHSFAPREVRQADFAFRHSGTRVPRSAREPRRQHARTPIRRGAFVTKYFRSPVYPVSVPDRGGDAAAGRSPGPRPPPSPATRPPGRPAAKGDRAARFLTPGWANTASASGGSPSTRSAGECLGHFPDIGPARQVQHLVAGIPACRRSPRRRSASRIASHCVRRASNSRPICHLGR